MRKALKWIAALALVGGGVAFWVAKRPASDTPVTFRKLKVDRGPVEQVVTATGTLAAVVTVQVGSQVSGTIQKLFADFNSKVTEGQVIAQLDPTRFKASLEQAHATLKNAEAAAARAKVNFKLAKADWERARELGERKVIGQAELDLVRNRFELAEVELASTEAQQAQARAQVGIARVDLERTTIKAPISGTVLSRAVDVGQTVAASLQAPTLFTIAQDLSRMEVRASIDEADVGKLTEGVDARFTVDAYPGEEFVATIHQIRSQPNVVQNVVTYDAILRVDNPSQRLRPGMTANVRIVTQRRENVLRVPNAALRWKPVPELIVSTQGAAEERRREGKAPAADGKVLTAGAPPAAGPGGERPTRGDGARAAGGDRPGGRPRFGARVYKPQGEKVLGVPFQPGVADDEYTEVVSGGLAPGDEVVTEVIGGPPSLQGQGARGNPMRGRGPRFF